MTRLADFAHCSVAVERQGSHGSYVQAFDMLTEALDALFDGLQDGDDMPLAIVQFGYPAPPRIITQEVVDALHERQRDAAIDERHRNARRIA